MELGLWSTLWANCALGTTFLALPAVPVIGTDNQTIQLADEGIVQEHETVETQTVELSSSESEESDAPDDSDKEGDGEDVDVQENIQNNGSSSDSNSIQSAFDNNTETSTIDSEVKVTTRTGKKKKSYQRIRYSREEYKCTMCPYTCTTERAFLRHLRSHSSESDSKESTQDAVPRLSCPVCGKDRSGDAALSKHMQKHRDNRHFCCDICSFKTVQLKKLIQHRRMHTGERPHLCPHCVYRAARRDNLRSHVRRVHKRDNLTCDTFSPRGMLLVPSSSATTTTTSSCAKDDN